MRIRTIDAFDGKGLMGAATIRKGRLGKAMSTIRSPEQRCELLANLHALSDPVYQRRVWIEGQAWGSVKHDEFDYAVHFFFDDSTLKDDPQGNIGWMLVDATEATLVTAVIDAVDAIFEKYGTRLKDAEYIALPEWGSVVEAARAALSVMPERDQVRRHPPSIVPSEAQAMNTATELRTRVLLTLQASLLGLVTADMRTVLVSWTESTVDVRIFFLGVKTDADQELASEIETQIISHLPDQRVSCTAERCSITERVDRRPGEVLVFQRASEG